MKITKEKEEEIENKHFEFQNGIFFSGERKSDSARFLYSDGIKDFYFNYTTQIKIKADEVEKLVEETKQFFKAMNRQPAIYTTKFTTPKNITKFLEKNGFKPQFTDTWMVYKGEEINKKSLCELNIKEIETQREKQIAFEIFNKAYGGEDQDNLYRLPEYFGEAYMNSFKKRPSGNIKNYLASYKGKPAGVATLIFDKTHGAIYNVGVLSEHRRKGIGTALSLKAVEDAKKQGCNTIFLMTEKSSYVENFYKKLGFERSFIGNCFVLEAAE